MRHRYIGEKEYWETMATGDKHASTMATIAAYADRDKIGKHLEKYSFDWRLVWQPVDTGGIHYAFIAFNGYQYCVAIGGKVLEFSMEGYDHWVKDYLKCFDLVDWEYTEEVENRPMVSEGVLEGVEDIIALKDEEGRGIIDFLIENAIPENYSMAVVGWSAGGTIATAFALWLKLALKKQNHRLPKIFSTMTFGAPQVWNKSFCLEFDKNFKRYGWRAYNLYDPIPYTGIDFDTMSNIMKGYEGRKVPISDEETLDDYFTKLGDLLIEAEEKYETFYYETNIDHCTTKLNLDQFYKPLKRSEHSMLDLWFAQAKDQHHAGEYMIWVGVPYDFRPVFKEYYKRHKKRWWKKKK